jgi:hypothetical protein
MKKLLLGLGLLLSVNVFAGQYCKVVYVGSMTDNQREEAVNKVIRAEQDRIDYSILTDIKVSDNFVYLIFTDDK